MACAARVLSVPLVLASTAFHIPADAVPAQEQLADKLKSADGGGLHHGESRVGQGARDNDKDQGQG